MARIPFALVLVMSLAVTVGRAGPAAHLLGAPGLRAPQPHAAALAPRPQPQCHAREVSVSGDPRDLLVRIVAAALRVAAQMFRMPGWPGAPRDRDLSEGDDLRAAIDALWSCLTEASRTASSRGDWP